MDELDSFIAIEDQKSLSIAALENLMREVLDNGRRFRFQAKGGSMAPFILDGDLVTISPLLDTPPRIGEVVAFSNVGMGKLAVHRVVSQVQNRYHIQGDNQTANGRVLIPRQNILGRVTLVERGGKIIGFGLGPEKHLIAFLSRKRLLQPYLALLAPLLRPLRNVLICLKSHG